MLIIKQNKRESLCPRVLFDFWHSCCSWIYYSFNYWQWICNHCLAAQAESQWDFYVQSEPSLPLAVKYPFYISLYLSISLTMTWESDTGVKPANSERTRSFLLSQQPIGKNSLLPPQTKKDYHTKHSSLIIPVYFSVF